MMMPGRKYNANNLYRYGFNGKENDNEVKGEANQQDYGMRIYDPRLGRFLSVDPLEDDYPWNSPYAFAENDPINFVDLDGQEKSKSDLVNLQKQIQARLEVIKSNAHLLTIVLHGASDAYLNANMLGLYELFSGTDLDDYNTDEEREAYLYGRLGGDIGAGIQGLDEIAAGGGVALTTGGETMGAGAAVGAGISAHGFAMGVEAANDIGWSLNKIRQLNITPASNDAAKTTNDATNQQAKAANNKSDEAAKSNSSTNAPSQKSSSYKTRTTRDGSKAVTIERPSGRVKDISKKRVKEYVPNPRNPSGKPAQVNFKKAGTPKGTQALPTDPQKRTLNKKEQKFINRINTAT